MEIHENSIYLVWRDPGNGRKYTVGKLTRGNGYRFEYCLDNAEARRDGWPGLFLTNLYGEDDSDDILESTWLFPVFACRLPDRKRVDIDVILAKYGMDEYDGFELLRRSGARLPTDTYEFVEQPVRLNRDTAAD